MGTVANATDTASVTGTSDPKQAHIAHLTALCKQLQQKQAIEDEMPPEERKAKEENEDIEVSSLQHLVSEAIPLSSFPNSPQHEVWDGLVPTNAHVHLITETFGVWSDDGS